MSEVVSVDLELDRSLQLETLAIKANEAHERAESAAHSAINHARRAGECLAEAKGLCNHGEWSRWLKANFKGAERTARTYMQVHNGWASIQERQRAAVLSVRQALELLSDKPDEPEESEPPEPDEDEPEIVPPPSGLIKSFGDARLTRSWEAHELSTDVAVLIGQVKAVCGPLTYETLWEHAHEDAKVRRSEPQLRHLLHIGRTNDDAETADMVGRVEDGSAKDIFDAHKQRQAEREEAARPKLSDADKAIAEGAAQDLVGFDKRVSDEGLADMRRITLELSQTDGWDDLDADEKQRFIQTQAGEEMAASIKSSRPTAKPPYKNANAHLRALVDQYAPTDKVAEFVKWWGEL